MATLLALLWSLRLLAAALLSLLLTAVTPGVRKPAFRTQSQRPAWFPDIFGALSAKERACVVSFAASFRKAAAMDF